jgi:hypothetical protein
LAAVEDRDFAFTTLSLREAAELSFKHALQVITRSGGAAAGAEVAIPVRPIEPVRLERNFEGHFPSERRRINSVLESEFVFDFDGIGFALNGEVVKKADPKIVLSMEVEIDGRKAEVVELPAEDLIRRETLFWKYRLAAGPHRVRLKLLDPRPGAAVSLGDLVVYADRPRALKRNSIS